MGFSLGYSHFFAWQNVMNKVDKNNFHNNTAVSKFLWFWLINYPKRPSSMVALYWGGISMRAESANSVSFRDCSLFFDMISVKFTNYKQIKERWGKCKNQSLMLQDVTKEGGGYLEVIKSSGRYVIIKFLHHVPWSIPHPN